MNRTELHLSRNIEVTHADGTVTSFALSIAEIELTEDNVVASVRVAPFERELPGTLYHDTPLMIRIGEHFHTH